MENSCSRFSSLFVALALCAASTSCVSAKRHDEALSELRYYQRSLADLESFHGTCEAKITRLEGELAIRAGEPIEAAMTAEIDERLDELGRIMENLGAPGDVAVLAVEGGYGLRLSNAVLFESASAELSDEGRALLGQMAEEISAQPFERIWVRGHTDSDPIVRDETKRRFPRGNLQLASERAIGVAGLLAEKGIPMEKLVVAGFGASEPLVPNLSAEQKRANRRVEIFVIESAGSDPSNGDG